MATGEDQVIKCVDCGEDFLFTFLVEHGLPWRLRPFPRFQRVLESPQHEILADRVNAVDVQVERLGRLPVVPSRTLFPFVHLQQDLRARSFLLGYPLVGTQDLVQVLALTLRESHDVPLL